jgi:Zn-dependent protease
VHKSAAEPQENSVPPLVGYLAFLCKELLRVPFDVIAGIKRRIYVLSSDVNAPKDICWDVVSAHKIRLEGTPPIELDTEPDPLRPGVFSGVCRFGDRTLAFAYQVLDERPGEAMTLRLLLNECDPVYRLGDDYVGAVAVSGDDHQSIITNSCELTHTRFMPRLMMPLTLIRGLQSLKHTAEVRAGNGQRTTGDQIKSALLTGILTFASFFALFGGAFAAGLLIVILLHELGHVIAMRWAGIPVRGIYFVPFFGGVAVGESLGTSEITRGFIALMGPAFSILTTILFVFLSLQSNEPFLADLALLSALLNGFNLLPILPLDGGRVLQALTSRIGQGAARIIHATMLCLGIAIALFFGDFLLLAVMLLIAPAILRAAPSAVAALAPLTRGEFAWLSAGYVATLTFYVAIALRLWNETPILSD